MILTTVKQTLIFCLVIVNHLVSQPSKNHVKIISISQIDSDARIRSINTDNDSIVWIASSVGLIQADYDGNIIQTHLAGQEIVDAMVDPKGNLWAVSTNILYDVHHDLQYPIDHPTAQIQDITYYKGCLWMATNTGLFQFNVSTSKYKIFDVKNSILISNQIHFVHADRHNIMWVGTSKGYLRIENDKWKLEDKKYQMLATCENNEGQWIVNQEDMFLLNQYNRLFPVHLDKSQYLGKINNFVIDSKGKIFIASDILSRYDPYTERVDNYADDASILSKATLSLSCDSRDNIWVGTDGAGLYKLSFDKKENTKLHAACIIQNPIQCYGQKNGSLKVSVQGGSPPYYFIWENGSTMDQLTELGSGQYAVTVFDQAGDSSIAKCNLSGPQPLSISNTKDNKTNYGLTPDGMIALQVSGGKSPYQYRWSNHQNTPVLSGLASGEYIVTVTDRNGCTSISEYLIKKEKYLPDLKIEKVSVGQKLRISKLNFDADSSNITSDNYDILNEVYDFLNENPSVVIEIGGHTNTIPSHEYCDRLSTARAKHVAEYLIRRGIDPVRVTNMGYGKREPITDSTSLQARQINQRVEIKILKI